MKGLAILMGLKPKGGKAPKDVPRPGAKTFYRKELEDAFKDRDGDNFVRALDGYVQACIKEAD